MSTEPIAIWLDEEGLRTYFDGDVFPEHLEVAKWLEQADDARLSAVGQEVLLTNEVWDAITQAILDAVRFVQGEMDGDDEQD